MLFDDLGDAARTLVRCRGRAFGDELASLAHEFANFNSQELADAFTKVEKNKKSSAGLLLARVALEEAVTARSRELYDRFLFRFGAHLKLSVSEPGLSSAQRIALATAAEALFDALPSATTKQRSDIASIRSRLRGPDPSERDWRSTLGTSESEFTATMAQFRRELSNKRRQGTIEATTAPPAPPQSTSVTVTKSHPTPPWLSVAFSATADPLVQATANWVPQEVPAIPDSSIPAAWSAFCEGEYLTARNHLSAILGRLGEDWGPTSGADAVRTWNWIRLVCELAALANHETSDARRSWTSACELTQRCLPDHTDLQDEFLSHALGDFVASDLASKRALNAYTTRLVAELGHEAALVLFDNREKATLRTIWAESFSLSKNETRSTATAAAAITPLHRDATQRLYVGARSNLRPNRVLREVTHNLTKLLDEAEGVLLSDGSDLVQEVERLVNAEKSTQRDLSDLARELGDFKRTIAKSGSSLLQDYLAPLIQISTDQIAQAINKLVDISRPQVVVSMGTAKVPFSAAAGSGYQIRVIATNTGNTAAEAIAIRVVETALRIDSTARLDTLGQGAQAELNIDAVATGASSKAVSLHCEIQWSDARLQQFSTTQILAAEDQRPVAWTSSDVNPFNLGTISEPERLVGRAEDLASLEALLAGNASAYVTGHKRVGKTSLVRVLLNSARDTRGWAGSLLPLGRALGGDQTAGDLVYGLLDEILDAARGTYGRSMENITDVMVDDTGNFARAANKWLRGVARVLPSNARVIVAVDDFDELPPHLVKGPQADALFLFLRSLVDEPWLNLIVVGSEILPSIIQAQAHKLNQVVPVSVTNFSSRASTAELLETPTADRLEWLPEAVDKVHYLCAGNPYYETLLAQRLWLNMREWSRSVVTASDIDEAAGSIARSAPDSHFVHLWADSSTGLDHTSRSAIVASAVLRSIARGGGAKITPASPDEVTRLAQGWIQTATSDELLKSLAELKSREIVKSTSAADRMLISIPLVSIWLENAGGRALDAVYATSKHATAMVRMITDGDLVELGRNLRYRGEQVTEIRIKAWLEQFGGNDRQYLAYKMLRRMILDGFFTPSRLQSVEVPRLVRAISELDASRALLREANNQYLRNAYLIDHGVPGDSTQGTLSVLAKALRIKKANIIKAADLNERIRTIGPETVFFLLDDYCGTGTHLRRELDALVDTLTALGEEWVESARVVVGASVVADPADLPAQNGAVTVESVGGTFLSDRFRPFTDGSGIFDTVKEREDAEQMTASIGRALVPNNPLGFGGRALLTLFEFNCPNNVAPIFWKAGSVSGTDWIPLFERAI